LSFQVKTENKIPGHRKTRKTATGAGRQTRQTRMIAADTDVGELAGRKTRKTFVSSNRDLLRAAGMLDEEDESDGSIRKLEILSEMNAEN
jgi:hypothetical protein